MVRAPLHFHGRIPVPEVAPLTYRDGVTQLELVYELSEYLKNILHPSLQSTVEQVVADAERLLSEANAQYVDGVQEFQRIHDAFMSDVNAHLMALNDGAVSDLVNDETSLLGKTLRELFVPNSEIGSIRNEMEFYRHQTTEELGNFKTETTAQLTELGDSVDARVESLEHSTEDTLNGFRTEMQHVPHPAWLLKFRGVLAVAESQRVNLMFFGSSTTRGGTTGNDSVLSYVPRLASMIEDTYRNNFPVVYSSFAYEQEFLPDTGVSVINAGDDGTFSSDYIPQRLVESIAATSETGPTVCFHMVGSNDATNQIAPEQYRKNLETVLSSIDRTVKGSVQHVFLHSYETKRSNGLWEAYGAILENIAESRGGGFIDLSRAYELIGFPFNDSLNMLLPDGVHQNGAGHAFMADLLRDYLHIPSTRSKSSGHDGVPKLTGFDQFTGSTKTTLTSRAPIVGKWKLLSGSLNWDCVNGCANPRGNNVAFMETGSADHGVEVTLRFSASTINSFSYGAVVRGNPLNPQSFRVYFHGTRLVVSRMSSSGRNSVIDDVLFVRSAGTYRLRVEVKRRVLSVWVNDQLFMSYDMPANVDYFHSDKTYVGMRASSTGPQIFDEFRAYTV